MTTETVERGVEVLRQTTVALVRRDGPDLSARQLGVFLTCYLESVAQTVNATLWWTTTQTTLRIAFGLSLWGSYALQGVLRHLLGAL